MSSERISQLRSRISAAPVKEDRLELVRLLVDQPGARAEAREHCFSILAEDPNEIRCRLLLARLFYLDRYTEFAIREIVECCRRRPVGSLHRLLKGFGQAAAPYIAALAGPLGSSVKKELTEKPGTGEMHEIEVPVTEVAEIDLDADMIDILNELEEVPEE